jgi:hypothetical protein
MRKEYRRITYPTLKDEKMGDYSIHIIFPQDPDRQESRLRVYAGRAASKNKAIELACELLHEEGGGVEAVDVIDWANQDETFVSQIGSDDDGPEAA